MRQPADLVISSLPFLIPGAVFAYVVRSTSAVMSG
jgi:hypothetical protein